MSANLSHVANATGAAAPTAREVLTFRLGAEEYGIDILRTQEIRSHVEPTHLANAPAHIKGVINLRGVIVPVIDLRIRLHLDSVPCDAATVVIMLSVAGRTVGMVVDSVTDVVELDHRHLRDMPRLDAGANTDFVTAIGSIGERMLILLDVEHLLGEASLLLPSPDVH
jgi:purine-binding chemotaxis protein CheW